MKTQISALLTSAAVMTGATITLASAPTHAATIACSTDISGLVTGTSACEVSDSANQDFLNRNPMTVNAEEFFGNNDWVFGGKIGENAGFNGQGSGQSGNWDISSVVQSTWNDVMLVFKSGNGTFLTGYEVTDGVTSGTWSSPFPQFKNNGDPKAPKNVSHISVYHRVYGETPRRVPEPASLIGLGIVASGMVMARRRQVAHN
ncbi:MAG: PEP-CTERM sorting domain-containing protein [Sphaerospermopsis sp. SIO1G2]|nr:PEP-CTERM sorting domain-containing protein [Sphaerospermopsis sp. SIO1G1]NET72692.1 PEP-CTERM sorting domain-containing protein [Sphaerospermopsis sp. SIO1G2]